jgi:hypothetical protein
MSSVKEMIAKMKAKEEEKKITSPQPVRPVSWKPAPVTPPPPFVSRVASTRIESSTKTSESTEVKILENPSKELPKTPISTEQPSITSTETEKATPQKGSISERIAAIKRAEQEKALSSIKVPSSASKDATESISSRKMTPSERIDVEKSSTTIDKSDKSSTPNQITIIRDKEVLDSMTEKKETASAVPSSTTDPPTKTSETAPRRMSIKERTAALQSANAASAPAANSPIPGGVASPFARNKLSSDKAGFAAKINIGALNPNAPRPPHLMGNNITPVKVRDQESDIKMTPIRSSAENGELQHVMMRCLLILILILIIIHDK